MFYGHLLDQNLMERRTSRRKRVWLVYDVQLKPFALKWRRLIFNILFKNFYDQILEFSNVFLHKIFKFSRTKIACLQKILLEEQNNVLKHHNFKEALKFLLSQFSQKFSQKKKNLKLLLRTKNILKNSNLRQCQGSHFSPTHTRPILSHVNF